METNENQTYHNYTIRVDREILDKLDDWGIQYKTCLVWKKNQSEEKEDAELIMTSNIENPEIHFKLTYRSVEDSKRETFDNDDKTTIVELFIEDGWENWKERKESEQTLLKPVQKTITLT